MSKGQHVFDSLTNSNKADQHSFVPVGGPGGHSQDKRDVDPSAIDGFVLDPELSDTLNTPIFDVKSCGSIPAVIANMLDFGVEKNSFLVTNLACVVKQWIQWRAELPMVEPFYAVKCNPDVAIVRLLASLGCSFDCATMGEIDLVVNKLGNKLSFGSHPGKALLLLSMLTLQKWSI